MEVFQSSPFPCSYDSDLKVEQRNQRPHVLFSACAFMLIEGQKSAAEEKVKLKFSLFPRRLEKTNTKQGPVTEIASLHMVIMVITVIMLECT